MDHGGPPLVAETLDVLDTGSGMGEKLPVTQLTPTGARFRRRDRARIAEHVRDSSQSHDLKLYFLGVGIVRASGQTRTTPALPEGSALGMMARP